MEKFGFLLVGFLLCLWMNQCSCDKLKVNDGQDPGLISKKDAASEASTDPAKEKTKKLESSNGSNKIDGVKSENGQVGIAKNEVKDDGMTGNSNQQGELRQEPDKGNKDSGVIEKTERKQGNDESDKVGAAGDVSEEKPKGNGKEGDSGSVLPLRKEGPREKICGASNKCTDDANKLVACLMVPGNDASHLSLLIQNIGKDSLNVTISSPTFVHPEHRKVNLQGEQRTEVKVSIDGGGADSLIVLNAGTGKCTLDIRDMPQNSGKAFTGFTNSLSTDLFKRTPIIAFLGFAALLVVVSSWMCISMRRKHVFSSDSRYQRLDMELPASNVMKTEIAADDGWDDGWGDGWDDEEAPKTPSMPVTPSLSSKGLAPRRANKEGWKD